MKRVTAAEVGASRDGGKGAAEMSPTEATEMAAAEASATKAAAEMAATKTTADMAATAETAGVATTAETTAMAAATAAARQCGGR
jgi:hypothetical protein